MKGLNTKTRYQVKLLLAVAALALLYNSSGWGLLASTGGWILMGYKGKKESAKNVWWFALGVFTTFLSLLSTFSGLVSFVFRRDLLLAYGTRLFINKLTGCVLIAALFSSSIIAEDALPPVEKKE